MLIGVLALQGDFEAHFQILKKCGAEFCPVRAAGELEACDALILPGGESTTMSRLCDRYNLWEPLQMRAQSGMPIFGTCAGMILLAADISGGAQTFAQKTLGALDIGVARNAYGAQKDSFEADIEVPLLRKNVRGVFIRAPQISRVGKGVEVLASYDGKPVVVRHKNILACAFHPEIVGESALHQFWIDAIKSNETSAGETSSEAAP